MRGVVVDSSVWIDHLRGLPTSGTRMLGRLLDALDPLHGEDDPADILVPDLVLLEVLRGIDDDRQHDRTRDILLAFPQVEIAGTGLALKAAAAYRRLRREGITVRKAIDCLIASWCIEHDVPLLHSDRDFGPFVQHCGLREVV
jgi:hypothetical protein